MEKNTPQPPKCPSQKGNHKGAKKQGSEAKYKNRPQIPNQPDFGF